VHVNYKSKYANTCYLHARYLAKKNYELSMLGGWGHVREKLKIIPVDQFTILKIKLIIHQIK